MTVGAQSPPAQLLQRWDAAAGDAVPLGGAGQLPGQAARLRAGRALARHAAAVRDTAVGAGVAVRRHGVLADAELAAPARLVTRRHLQTGPALGLVTHRGLRARR